MKLLKSKLCVDCDEVVEDHPLIGLCPGCMSRQFLFLIDLIDPEFIESRKALLKQQEEKDNGTH